MRKRVLAVILAGMMAGILAAGCGSSAGSAAPEQKKEEAAPQETEEPVELQVFIAASLNTSMQEVAAKYNEEHPNVKITFNADSPGPRSRKCDFRGTRRTAGLHSGFSQHKHAGSGCKIQ